MASSAHISSPLLLFCLSKFNGLQDVRGIHADHANISIRSWTARLNVVSCVSSWSPSRERESESGRLNNTHTYTHTKSGEREGGERGERKNGREERESFKGEHALRCCPLSQRGKRRNLDCWVEIHQLKAYPVVHLYLQVGQHYCSMNSDSQKRYTHIALPH